MAAGSLEIRCTITGFSCVQGAIVRYIRRWASPAARDPCRPQRPKQRIDVSSSPGATSGVGTKLRAALQNAGSLQIVVHLRGIAVIRQPAHLCLLADLPFIDR